MGINEKIIFGSLEELRGSSFMYDPQLIMFEAEEYEPLPTKDCQLQRGCPIKDSFSSSDYLRLIVDWAIKDIDRGDSAEDAIASALGDLPTQDLSQYLDILKSCVGCQSGNQDSI